MNLASRPVVAALAAALTTAATAPAAAPSLSGFSFAFDYDGPIRIDFQAGSAECDSRVTGTTCYGGNDPNPSPGVVGPGNGTFNETTYAIGQVEAFRTADDVLLWSAAAVPAYDIAFFIYGVADLHIDEGEQFPIYNIGCTNTANPGADCDGKIHMDFYLVDKLSQALPATLAVGQRTGFSTFAGITDGTLLLRTEFVPSGPPTWPNASLIQLMDYTLLPTFGDGAWLAQCSGGPLCTVPGVNNVFLNLNGQTAGSDIAGGYTLGAAPDPWQANGWLGEVTGTADADNAVPSPGVLALLAAGLPLAGRLRRARR